MTILNNYGKVYVKIKTQKYNINIKKNRRQI